MIFWHERIEVCFWVICSYQIFVVYVNRTTTKTHMTNIWLIHWLFDYNFVFCGLCFHPVVPNCPLMYIYFGWCYKYCVGIAWYFTLTLKLVCNLLISPYLSNLSNIAIKLLLTAILWPLILFILYYDCNYPRSFQFIKQPILGN